MTSTCAGRDRIGTTSNDEWEMPTVSVVMPDTHPIVPNLPYGEVAVVLALALVGACVPRHLEAPDARRLLRVGVLACGGIGGVRRLAERDRQINLAMLRNRGRGFTADQKREKHALWSGGSRREQSLINLAFGLVNTEDVVRTGTAA